MFRKWFLIAALAATTFVVSSEIAYRVARIGRFETLHGFVSQLRAFSYVTTRQERDYHVSLVPRPIPIGQISGEHAAGFGSSAVVASFNMAAPSFDGDLQAALATIVRIRHEYDPDVLFLTEAPGELDLYGDHEAFRGMSGIYAWDLLEKVDAGQAFRAQSDGFQHTGNALLSRHRIRDPRVVVLPKVEEDFLEDALVLRNAVMGRVGEIDLLNVHLAGHTRPIGRFKQVETLRPYLGETTIPGGDWNFYYRHVSDFIEPGYEALVRMGFRDTLTANQRFVFRSRYSLAARMFAFADHVFVPPVVAGYESQVFKGSGSDHDVIVVQLSFGEGV